MFGSLIRSHTGISALDTLLYIIIHQSAATRHTLKPTQQDDLDWSPSPSRFLFSSPMMICGEEVGSPPPSAGLPKGQV